MEPMFFFLYLDFDVYLFVFPFYFCGLVVFWSGLLSLYIIGFKICIRGQVIFLTWNVIGFVHGIPQQ